MKYRVFAIVLIVALFGSCKNDDGPKGFPGVTTSPDLTITEEGVEVSAEIQNEHLFEIIDHGFVYSPIDNGNEESYDRVSLGPLTSLSFSAKIDRNLRVGKSYVVEAYVKTKNRTVYGNPISFTSKGSKKPIINSFFPETAYYSDTITISGDYFSNKANENIISFGNRKVVPVFSDGTTLKVLVPDFNQTAVVQLSVEVAGMETVAVKKFTLGLPVVKSLSPENPVPTETVTVKGKGFLGVSSVSIDGIQHVVSVDVDSTFKFVLSESVSKGIKLPELKQLDRIVPSDKTLAVTFPEITSVSPLILWLDSVLVIRGTNLDKLSYLSLQYQEQELISMTDTLVKMRIKRIFNSGYVRAKFRYNDISSNQVVKMNPPVITSIVPSTAGYGETIHIYGDRFFPELMSSLGQITYLNKNEITMVVPWNLNAGAHLVNLNFYEVYPGSPASFTIPEIQITEVSPREIKRGSTIKIKGKNFPKNYNSYYVSCNLDNSGLKIESISEEEITAYVTELAVCSENPTLTINVGMQQKSLTGALHFSEPWQIVDHAINLYHPTLFVSANGLPYALSSGQLSAAIKQFDTGLEQWSLLDNVSKPALTYSLTSFSLGNNLYFAGSNEYSQIPFYTYSLADRNWRRLTDFTQQIWGHGQPFKLLMDGKLYLGSGAGLFQYEPIDDKWINKTKLPTLRVDISHPVSFVIDSKGYVAFPTETIGLQEFSEFWEYDLQTNSWKDLGSLPFGITNGSTATVYNGRAYLVGDAYRSEDKFMEFDPLTYKFKELLPPPMPRGTNCFLFVQNSDFYFISVDYYNKWMYKIPVSELQNIYR